MHMQPLPIYDAQWEPTAPHPFEVIKYHVDTRDPTPFYHSELMS